MHIHVTIIIVFKISETQVYTWSQDTGSHIFKNYKKPYVLLDIPLNNQLLSSPLNMHSIKMKLLCDLLSSEIIVSIS